MAIGSGRTAADEVVAVQPSGSSILGTRVKRVEDRAFLTRGATYTADLVDDRLAGAVFVDFVRSPIAHARVESIDTSAALAHPGCVAVYTAKELTVPPFVSPLPFVDDGFARPLLAGDTVRYVGEPVAIVVARSPYLLEDVADLVTVDYTPLPVVVDAADAVTDEVLLFPEIGTNLVHTWAGAPFDEGLFDGCEVVVTRTITNQRLAPAPMETRAAAALWTDEEHLTFWQPNQGGPMVQGELAGFLGIDPHRIHIITPDVGGAFGAKHSDPEHALVAWAARQLGRPARWTETRTDNLLGMTHGRGQTQTITIGGSRDGRVIAYRFDALQDNGAYPALTVLLSNATRSMTPGVYAFERCESRIRNVLTNTTPTGAYRGAGRPEAAAAVERAIDLFAAEIGMDPVEVRRRNLIAPFTEPHPNGFGPAYDTGDYPEALRRVLDAAGYDELRAEQRRRRDRGDARALGIGVATYVEITGSFAPGEGGTVEVHSDGTATVLTGTAPSGQGHQTAWAMLVSSQTGIPIEKITVRYGDTDLIPEGVGTFGSRSLQQGGVAVLQAAQQVVRLARERAARLLEADVDDIVVDTDRAAVAVTGAPGTAIALADLARDEPLVARARFDPGQGTFPFGAHVAVVEVDLETGRTTLLRLVAVDDAGTILNPTLAEGQVHGGLAQGAAQALFEEMAYDADGNPLTASFVDYAFPSAMEVPSFELVPMATPTPVNPLGAKGIGESGTVGATPAVQNAVVDAVAHLGVRHIDMPATPRRVWQAIRAARATRVQEDAR